MQFILFLISFLLCSSTMHAMKRPVKLTVTNASNSIHIVSDDILSTDIFFWLDRPARNALRCTCTRYLKCILSQDQLNLNYKNARDKNDNSAIIYWKNMGAFLRVVTRSKATWESGPCYLIGSSIVTYY